MYTSGGSATVSTAGVAGSIWNKEYYNTGKYGILYDYRHIVLYSEVSLLTVTLTVIVTINKYTKIYVYIIYT